MVTSYYIMQMSKSKTKSNNEEYYNDLFETKLKIKSSSCRVCLKEGEHSIHDNEDTVDIIDALKVFTEIEINDDDGHPKYLCNVCYRFIKDAILFRKVAKHSYDMLHSTIKEETYDHSHDSHDYSDSVYESKHWSNNEDFSIKHEKKVKMKLAAKVTCHICNKVINRSYYKEHLTMHDPNHQKYVCDVCGKSFRLRCAYHNHSLRHRDDFPFKCQFCPYKARYAELLKTHMRTHTGDYRYMCTECPARFLFKSNLNTHMLKHKEPEYKCDACKRAFHTKLSLQRHFEADHLGIKNHVCNVCGKAFGYRNAMMKHQRHVHKREKMTFGRMPSYLEVEHKKPDC
ncbi:uncharacterized protein [Epargyreus clarus]|uniref:uncharacterized protein n=1 Tax=Epargyreus clarus TaxID=520877 RepID=UPI003C2B392F